MGHSIEIIPCRTPAEWRRFERVAEDLHGANPAFVPPFPGSVAKILSPASAFHKHHGTIAPFLAVRDGKTVGRIAAIVNRSHNSYYQDTVGFFGFFECENSPATAEVLFERAAEVIRAAGLTSLRGPYNPSINDDCGLLMQRHDLPPAIGLTWNPEYYPALLAAVGYTSVRTSYSLNLPLHRLQQPERLAKIVARLATRSQLALRTMNIKNLEQELVIVREVYNATLERNWGFVPISMEDLLGAADELRAIANPKLLLVATMHGQDAGVAITLPDFNQILIRTKSTPRWLRLPHIFWLMKTHRITSCRQTVLGVIPSCRDRGLHAWLIHEQFVRAQEVYEDATLGWIEADNTEVIKHSEIVGGTLERRWDIFQKSLDGPKQR